MASWHTPCPTDFFSSSRYAQCVVARRPSRSPAAASSSAPVQTEPKRETRPDIRRSHASRSEEHTSELQSRSDLVCRLLLEKKKSTIQVVPRIPYGLASIPTES